MPAIEYKVVAAGEKTPEQMTPDEVMFLSVRISSPVLYRCCQMAMSGGCSWQEAMQVAAVELAKISVQQHAEIVRLTGLLPAQGMFSNT